MNKYTNNTSSKLQFLYVIIYNDNGETRNSHTKSCQFARCHTSTALIIVLAFCGLLFAGIHNLYFGLKLNSVAKSCILLILFLHISVYPSLHVLLREQVNQAQFSLRLHCNKVKN